MTNKTCCTSINDNCPTGKPDASCVIYNGANLSCIGATTGAKLSDILVAIDSIICNTVMLEFNNGLTKGDGVVQFGGTLIKDTTLDLGVYDLEFDNVVNDDTSLQLLALDGSKKLKYINTDIFATQGPATQLPSSEAINGLDFTFDGISRHYTFFLGGPLIENTDIDLNGLNFSLTNVITDNTAAKILGLDTENNIIGLDAFVKSVNSGTDIIVDNTDPYNPIINNGFKASEVRRRFSGENVIYHELEPGSINDNSIPNTKTGAMSSATITKEGDYDKIAVSGGDVTSKMVFDDMFVDDINVVYKAVIKVSNLNADGVSNNALIGLGKDGKQLTRDTGFLITNGFVVDIINKTAKWNYYFEGFLDVTVTSSAGTLAVNGDILEIEQYLNTEENFSRVVVINRKTGEYLQAVSSLVNTSAPGNALVTGAMKIVIANMTAVIFEYRSLCTVPKYPLVQAIGDSYSFGFTQPLSGSLQPKFQLLTGRNFVNSCSNGGYIFSAAQIHLQEVLKLRPTYALFVSILSVFYGDFKLASPNNAAFMVEWNNLMNGIVGYGGIPINIKWTSPGGFTNGNEADWNAFLDAQQLLFPTMLILDFTNSGLVYNDSGHPNPASMIIMAQGLYDLILANGGL